MMFLMLAAVAAPVPKSPDNRVEAAVAKLDKQVKMLGVKEEAVRFSRAGAPNFFATV